MNGIIECKRKYPIIDKFVSDKFVARMDASVVKNDSFNLISFLNEDDFRLNELNESLNKLCDKSKFPSGNIASIIKHLKSSGVQFLNTLSELSLMMHFFEKNQLIDYEVPFQVNNKKGDFDLLIKVEKHEYLIDIINIEKAENDKLENSIFSFTGCVQECISNKIEKKILKKVREKCFSELNSQKSDIKLGIAVDYTKNQELYSEIKQSQKFFPNLFKDFSLSIFKRNMNISCLIFYEYFPNSEIMASNVIIITKESISNKFA